MIPQAIDRVDTLRHMFKLVFSKRNPKKRYYSVRPTNLYSKHSKYRRTRNNCCLRRNVEEWPSQSNQCHCSRHFQRKLCSDPSSFSKHYQNKLCDDPSSCSNHYQNKLCPCCCSRHYQGKLNDDSNLNPYPTYEKQELCKSNSNTCSMGTCTSITSWCIPME